jgi:hypothetical protein
LAMRISCEDRLQKNLPDVADVRENNRADSADE